MPHACRRKPCTTSSSGSSASKYRDCVILAASDCLGQLDGEEVKPAHRAFLHALQSRRAKARQQHRQVQEQLEQLSQQVSSMHMGHGHDPPAAAAAATAAAAAAAAAADQDSSQSAAAVAAGQQAQLSSRSEAAGCGVSGMKLQLAAALQPWAAGAARPTAAAGFKPSPKRAAVHRGAAAAAGALDGGAGQLDGGL